MAMELSSFTASPSGNNTLNLATSFTPTFIDFWVGPRNATTEVVNMASFGSVDITNGRAGWQSNFTDGTGSQTKAGSGTSTGSSCLQHYNRVSGTITKIIDMTFVSVAAGSYTVNLGTANGSYKIFARVFG